MFRWTLLTCLNLYKHYLMNVCISSRLTTLTFKFNRQTRKSVKKSSSGHSFDDLNSHAKMQKELAISLGVSKEDIIELHTPKDTNEEAIETKNIVQNEKIILVTSASHMKRAVKLFEKQEVNVIASPTEHKVYNTTYPSSYFNSNNLKKVELAFHEYLGRVYLKIKD